MRLDFWKQNEDRMKGLLGIMLCIAVLVVLIGSVLSQDPNNPYCVSRYVTSCTVQAKIYNDTNTLYTVRQCEIKSNLASCGLISPDDSEITISPGHSIDETGTTRASPPQPWVVYDQAGKIVGCVDLQFTRNVQQAVARISHLSSCQQYM